MSDTLETDRASRTIPESGHYSAAMLEVVDANFARRLERQRATACQMAADAASDRDALLEAVTRGDSLGNDLVFLLRYSADLLNKLVPMDGEVLPTVKDMTAAADRILKAIQTVKGKP